MSGTSMDGLDCGLFEITLTTNYKLDWQCIDFQTFRYSSDLRDSIKKSLQANKEFIQETDRKLGMEFAFLAEKFIRGRKIDLKCGCPVVEPRYYGLTPLSRRCVLV